MSNTNMTGNWYDTQVGKEITSKKYFHEGERFRDFRKRVASIFSDTDLQDSVFDAIHDADFFPAGRSLYGAGSKGKFKASMSNCYIMPMSEDTIESIFDTAKETARIFSYGGGVGICLSKLRPKGAKVSNAARTSTGACSFMEIFDAVGGVIGANNRRAALILGLNCSHPDIEEFLDIKKNNDKIQSANISILFDDAFMWAVKNNEMYTLYFKVEATGEEIARDINARDFFMKFAAANHEWAEPGCLFIDTIRRSNLLSAYPEDEYKIDISNPCAEYLGNAYNSCLSGNSLVTTLDGVRKIKDLVGSEGFVLSENSKYRPYHSVINKGLKAVKEITLNNGQKIKATADHRFMTVNGWKRVDELNCDVDEILVSSKPAIHIIDDYDEEYELYGWMHGDGWYSETIGISFNNADGDFDVKERLLPLFHRIFGTTDRKPLKDDEVSYQLQTESNEAMGICESLGFVKGRAYEKQLPKTFYKWTLKQQLSFIRGLLTADGFIYGTSGRQVNFSSTSKKLIEQVHQFLSSIGIFSRIHKTEFAEELKRRPQYKIAISNQSAFDYVEIFGFSGTSKTKKFNPSKDMTNVRVSPTKELVISIEDCRKELVYDIVDVHTTNSFYANGMLVHNCNLGSINLYNIVDNPFTKNAAINYRKLEQLVNLGVRALDEILDYGEDMQPLDKNRENIRDWRAIGLGVFGLADMLIALGVRYGSKESLNIIDSVMDDIWTEALCTSTKLAKEKGTFKKYNLNYIMESPLIYDRDLPLDLLEHINDYGLRNGSLLSIAPTGSIGTMAGLSGGAEPLFAISYERTTHALSDKKQYFKVYAKSVEHLLKHHGIDPDSITTEEIQKRFPFVVASHDIDPIDRVKVQAAMQYWVDNAISSTVNLKHEATVEDVFNTYMAAWESGCKGLTVFRDGCARTAILTTKPQEDVEKNANGIKESIKETYNLPLVPSGEKKVTILDSITPIKAKEFKRLDSARYHQSTACVPNLYVHTASHAGNMLEVFTSSQHGCKSNLGTITRLASLALRSGVKVDKVIEELSSNTCLACVNIGKKDLSCGHAVANAIKAEMELLNKNHKTLETCYIESSPIVYEKTTEDHLYLKCPECGENTLIPEGKCASCINCLYNKCE